MKYCTNCGKELTTTDDTMEISRRDGLQFGETIRKSYKALEFHIKCWEEIAGNQYIPQKILVDNKWWFDGADIGQVFDSEQRKNFGVIKI